MDELVWIQLFKIETIDKVRGEAWTSCIATVLQSCKTPRRHHYIMFVDTTGNKYVKIHKLACEMLDDIPSHLYIHIK